MIRVRRFATLSPAQRADAFRTLLELREQARKQLREMTCWRCATNAQCARIQARADAAAAARRIDAPCGMGGAHARPDAPLGRRARRSGLHALPRATNIR